MIALLDAHKAGLLAPKYWLSNLISGVIVGIVALPLAMAFAIASGVKPEQGIYTAIIAGFVVSVFGGSRLQIAGPTGAFIVVLSSITAKYGIDGLQIATMMAGGMLFLLGFARMGAVIRFIPVPVIAGFTAGIGVTIWVGQWKDFFGFEVVNSGHFHQKIVTLVGAFPTLHLPTTALALLSLFIVIYTPKLRLFRRIPGPLAALFVATVIQYLFQVDGIKTIGSVFGELPNELPDITLPTVTLSRAIELIAPAFAIAMLGAIESLLSAVVADRMAGTKHNSNQELIGQGLANMVAPLFGGFAATGAIARTATNIRNGGTGPLSGIVHSITLVFILVVLSPLAFHIPLATLAAILFVVAWNMSEVKHVIKLIKRAPRADVVILLITFTLTVFADLVVAVNIGVILAILHFLRRMASSVEVRKVTTEEVNHEFAHKGGCALPENVAVFAVEGPFFFGAVEQFDHLLTTTQVEPEFVIIRMKWVPFIDITGIEALENVINKLHNKGVNVILTGANERVISKLERAGIIELIGKNNNYTLFENAVMRLQAVSQNAL